MNNIQTNTSVNVKSNNTPPYTQTTDIKKQSPEKLKEKIESGELNESDFADKKDFDNFVAFLAKLLGDDIKIYSKPEITAGTINNKKENSLNDSVTKLHASSSNTDTTKSNNAHQLKNIDQEIIKEGVNNPTAKQMIQDFSLPVNVSASMRQNDVAIFKADNIDKSGMIKEQTIQFTDKTVILHSLGGNNLSITGNEIGAQGDANFLEQTRAFAPDEGFHENSKQHHSEDEENGDLEKIYFTKDSDQ